MTQIAKPDNRGMSLVEVLISLVVTLVLFLALMQTALVSINVNTRNALRDEAVTVAEARMTQLRNLDFNDLELQQTGGVPITEDQTDPLYRRKIKNISSPDGDFFQYTGTREVIDLGGLNADNKQVNITITWQWQGETYNHTVSTVVRRR